MPTYQVRGDVPRKRHVQFRDNGTLLTEEVMGLEGFSGNESILYHLVSPCRIRELGFVRADRARGMGARRPRAPAHAHGGHPRGRRRALRPQAPDVERRRGDLTLPADRRDGELLPQRRGRRGRSSSTRAAAPSRRSSATSRTAKATTSSSRAGRRTASPSTGPQRHLVFESPGLIEIPRRYRNEYGQLLEHAPYYHRDIHPPTELRTERDRGHYEVKVRVKDGIQTYGLDYHPFDVVGWDGYVYPWTFNINDFEPITGRIHMPPPSHQTFQGRNFVICSFCPRKLDFDPLAIPIPYHHSNLNSRGDALLRRRQLLVAEGHRHRFGDAASVGDPARAAPGARGEVDRDDRDARAGGHVRHVPPAAADDARARAGRSGVRLLVVRGRRPGARSTRIRPASRRTCKAGSRSYDHLAPLAACRRVGADDRRRGRGRARGQDGSSSTRTGSRRPRWNRRCTARGPAIGCLAPVFDDRVIANRFIYRFRDPRRGEIVVFDTPPAC